jgi:serine protease Do
MRLLPTRSPLALLAALALVAAACTGEGATAPDDGGDATGEPEATAATTGVADLVEGFAMSVVAITVTGTGGSGGTGGLPGLPDDGLPEDGLPDDGAEGGLDDLPAADRLQAPGEPGPGAQGQGSGIVYGDDLVVTNAHVVDLGEDPDVALTFADGSRAEAEVIATDERTDVAVLRVLDAGDLPVAEFTEALPRVGDLAVALGSPLGLENTVTSGVVSGLDRAIPGAVEAGIPALSGLIQTDAALSPGSSGGALIDADGRVIGMNVAFIPPQLRAVSIGFAIPAALVVDVVEQLLADGEVRHAFLGVQLAPLTGPLREQLGIEVEQGALGLGVGEGTPAEDAGIEGGDVILGIDGEPVRDLGDLTARLRAYVPGDEVEVAVQRDGEERAITVALGERPDETEAVAPEDLPDALPLPEEPSDEDGTGPDEQP